MKNNAILLATAQTLTSPGGKDASWNRNPKSDRIYTKKVTSKTVLKLPLAPGGGAAVSILGRKNVENQ